MSGRYGRTYTRRRRARDVRRAEERAAHTAGGGHDKWLREKVEIYFYYDKY
jgi:hypothetical protein